MSSVEMQGLTGLKRLKLSNLTKRKLVANPQLFLRYLKTMMPLKPSNPLIAFGHPILLTCTREMQSEMSCPIGGCSAPMMVLA